MNKNLPKIRSDQAARNLLKKDMTAYLSKKNFSRVSFEFAPKAKPVTMRMSEGLLNEVKKVAHKKHMPYQRVIRQAIEEYVQRSS